ncbi:hypothetical protein DID77_01740 [Candidatus Marinamargulisbacteria bacterium SCGC AG-439-L15]|nr:hypothetical protein DID77_01740 [Candidatus Marinamargulisbacteria bacterium SCGC AG-439-L15]
MSIDLDIDIEKEDTITILSVRGELDDYHAPKLNETFSQVIEQDNCKKVIVDLDGTTFIDSVGLGTLAIASKKIGSVDGHIKLVCTKSQITKLIDASGIIDAMKASLGIVDSIENAKASLKS